MITTDRRRSFYRAFEHAARVVEAIDPGQLSGATPCPQYDVAALVDHTVGAAHRAAALGRGEAPDGGEFPHIDLADAPGELRRAGAAAQAAWSDDAALSRQVTMPWGEVYLGSTLVDMYLTELAAHAWDLAAATGRRNELDPDLAPEALAGAQSMLKPEYRNLAEEGSPYGTEVEAPAGADEWSRLAAFTGRRPDWSGR